MFMRTESLQFLAANAIPDHRYTIDRPSFGYYGLQFVDAGGVKLTIDDREYDLEGQWMWCTYPGPHFLYKPLEKYGYWSHRYVTFRGSRVVDWVVEGLLPFEPQQVHPTSEYGARLDHLRSLLNAGDRLSRLVAVNELERIVLDLARERAESSERPSWLHALTEQLNNMFREQPDYASLAAEYCMSESTLRRQFKAFSGVPIHTYLLRRRIQAACEMLIHTDMPLKTIAERLGYRDVYFFSHQFRRFTGVSPSKFRHH
ncbi:MAG TPA: AraC family transcriptional regulator [Armatimonadota bacterium]